MPTVGQRRVISRVGRHGQGHVLLGSDTNRRKSSAGVWMSPVQLARTALWKYTDAGAGASPNFDPECRASIG